MSPASRADSARVSCVDRLAEVLLGGGRHAVGAVAEVDGVQVQLEDALLRVALLELPGEGGLGDLAVEGLLGVEQQRSSPAAG